MFKDQVVWITGASSGLGEYMAYEFARKGAKVVLSARRKEKLEEVLATVRSLGSDALIVPCDVTRDEDIVHAIDTMVNHFGRLDVAIANAGGGLTGKIETLTSKEWRRQLDLNVTSLALTARYTIPYLKHTGGRLVLVGSVAAYVPSPSSGAYGASKAAVRSIGQTLQVELEGTGVSCTVLHPGFIASDIARTDNEGVVHSGKEDPRPKNLIWPTDKAARVMVRAIAKRRRSFVFTGHGRFVAFMGQHLPEITRWLIGKVMPAKA